jgi:hypothetical protein
MGVNPDWLERDLTSPEFLHGVEQGFWQLVQRDNNFVFVLLLAPDRRSFLARLDCSQYWDEPIRCVFVDKQTHAETQQAWPDGNTQFEQWIKFRNQPHFVCWDQDRGGIEHHPDRKGLKAWQKNPNQLVAYLNFLRQMLYLPDRGYRRTT